MTPTEINRALARHGLLPEGWWCGADGSIASDGNWYRHPATSLDDAVAVCEAAGVPVCITIVPNPDMNVKAIIQASCEVQMLGGFINPQSADNPATALMLALLKAKGVEV